MTDWADEIAETVYMQRNATAAALRKAKAEGWRGCVWFLYKEGHGGNAISPHLASLMNIRADKIEKGQP